MAAPPPPGAAPASITEAQQQSQAAGWTFTDVQRIARERLGEEDEKDEGEILQCRKQGGGNYGTDITADEEADRALNNVPMHLHYSPSLVLMEDPSSKRSPQQIEVQKPAPDRGELVPQLARSRSAAQSTKQNDVHIVATLTKGVGVGGGCGSKK